MRGVVLLFLLVPAWAQFLGVNYWREDPPRAVAEKVRALGVGAVRVGGHYRDLTPYTRFDLLWLKEFLERAGIGRVLVQLPFPRQTPESLAQQARLVLEYLRPEGFLIGNEPDLYQRQGLGNWTPEAYAQAWRHLALAVRQVAPEVPLLGPSLSRLETGPWLEAFLRTNADLLQGVVLHHYPFDGKQDLEALLAEPERTRKILREVREAVRAWSGHDLPLYIGEFNSSWNWREEGPYGPSTYWNALYVALTLGVYLEEGVRGAFYWSLFDDGPLSLLDGLGRPRPSFHALVAFRGFLEAQPAGCPAPLRGFLRPDGKAFVLVNPSQDPRSCMGVDLPGYTLLAHGEGGRFFLTPRGVREGGP